MATFVCWLIQNTQRMLSVKAIEGVKWIYLWISCHWMNQIYLSINQIKLIFSPWSQQFSRSLSICGVVAAGSKGEMEVFWGELSLGYYSKKVSP